MIFNKAYNLENRRDFLNYLRVRLFGDNFDEDIKLIQIDRKTVFFEKDSCFELWKIILDKEVSIFEIKQRSKNDPRITLTRDAFKIMESKWVENALIVFYSDHSPSWRLSLLTLKKSWWETQTSNPKRYSFLLWEWEKTKTPEKYLDKTVSDFEDLVSRFDVEVVRKEFFNDYLTLYIRLYKAITDDSDFIKLLNSQKIEIVSFTKNLLWKIVFLYFIQKKWWLWVDRDWKYWEDWDKNFMRNMWNDFTSWEKTILEKHGYFYNDYLEWLFFAWLNKDNTDNDDFNEYFNQKVPFLNGWLFKEDYKWWRDNVSKISNDIFSNKNKDGILDTFDLYNFTIDEDDLYDSDIAVDPEMLGRIFEKMISISPENIDEIVNIYESKKKIEIDKELNKKFGAFYTPREIVHYMTKESIISYLLNNLKGKKEENERKIRFLFDLKEKFLVTKEDITEEVFETLANIIEEVDEKLQKVKILDPAIWSGAFPMGILHEISTIRYYIYETFGMNSAEFKNDQGKISMYKIKRDIIGNNIYWVDISAGAIDIARLRFWLSLVVDEETPEPLPNFEFKFVCANTLIPLAWEKQQASLNFEWIKELNVETLRKYMNSYYNANWIKDKEDSKIRIEKFLWIWKNLVLDMYNTKSERTKQLETYEPFNSNHSAEFFDPSLMMWNSKFDIVIWNPPYIWEKWNEKIFQDIFKTNFWKRFYTRWMDIFYFFFHIWLDLLKEEGILSFITTNYYITADGWINLRKDLNERSSIVKLINFNELNIFENAKWQHNIISFIEKWYKPFKKSLNISTQEKWSFWSNLWVLLSEIFDWKNNNTKYTAITQKDLYDGNSLYIRLDWNDNWDINNLILNKIIKWSKLIKEICDVSMWIVSLSDKISDAHIKKFKLEGVKKWDWVYVINNTELESLQLSESTKNEYIKPFYKNSDISRYYVPNNNSLFLIYIKDNWKPIILPEDLNKHFEKHKFLITKLKENFLKNEIAKSIVEKWFKNWNYFVLFTPKKEEYFNWEKIVFPYRNKKNIFSYSNERFYWSKDLWYILQKDDTYDLYYILSLLNSKLYYFWLYNRWKRKWDMLEMYATPISNVPIKEISEEKQKPFIEKADQILEITKQSFYDSKNPPARQLELEKEIDEMVYELYGLSEEEIKIVEESLR